MWIHLVVCAACLGAISYCVCSLFRSHQKGGRPNKQKKKCGCPREHLRVIYPQMPQGTTGTYKIQTQQQHVHLLSISLRRSASQRGCNMSNSSPCCSCRCPDMEDMAKSVANKYGRALMLYSKCMSNSTAQTHLQMKHLSFSISLGYIRRCTCVDVQYTVPV